MKFKPRTTTRPGDKVHHVRWSYGRILIPWRVNRRTLRWLWLGWFSHKGKRFGFRVVDPRQFHNCTGLGVY